MARWIARELSPAARLRDFALEARAALTTLARMAEPPPEPAAPTPEPPASPPARALHPAVWFCAGAAASALAFVLAVALRLGAVR